MNHLTRLALTALATVPMVGSTLAAASTEPTASWTISNAPVVGFETFPAFVQVVTEFPDTDDLFYCSGTLLANDAVLTSSECLRDTALGVARPYKPWPLDQLTVHHPLTGERMGVTAVHFPTPEAPFPENPADLAILKLYAPLETNARVTIPTQGLPFIRAGQGTVWGSGATGTEAHDENLTIDRAKLRKAAVPIHPSKVCTDNARLSYMLCAEAPHQDLKAPHTCAGDEGSPLMILSDDPNKAIQVGLTGGAFRMVGDAGICDGEPLYYTNLTAYSDWIASIVPTVSRKPYGLQGPEGPPVPAGPTPKPPVPAPAPSPSRQLSCGDVVDAGSQRPASFADGTVWQPPRGPEAGSEVSIGASQLTWGKLTNEEAEHVVLAGECAWADALPANVYTRFGPLLLTDSKALEPAVAAEIDRLNVNKVIIVGGPNAVSPAVEQALKAKGKQVTRVQGETRLETAVAVAEDVKGEFQDLRVFVARAYPAPGGSPSQAFADSLGAAFGVTWEGMPVLLSETDHLSEPTAKWIDQSEPSEAWLMGGELALSKAVETALYTDGEFPRMTKRYAGASRADTAAKLAMEKLHEVSNIKPKGVLILDSQGDDAWKTGFVFGGPAVHGRFVYGLASGDVVPEETKAIIRMARQRNLDVYCVASATACREVANTK